MILISIIILFISFLSKGFMDKSSEGKFQDIYLNKDKSWANKYADGLFPYVKKWYYFGIITPAYKERFPYSSTIFVFLTDFWHGLQFVFLNGVCVVISINYPYPVLAYIGIHIIYFIAFHLAHKK